MKSTNPNDRDLNTADKNAGRDSNPDAITGAPGSHPISTGVGAAAAGAAGAAIGSVVPGVGTVIGGVVGAVVGAVGGGYAGKAVGEVIDPTGTDDYWRTRHAASSNLRANTTYDTYRPAYLHGATLAERDVDTFDDSAARTEWEAGEHNATLPYDDAKTAMRAEYDRRVQIRRAGQGADAR